MKILLKGYYGFGNLGDDILLKVTFANLRRKFTCQEIDVFSNYNENLKGFEKAPHYNQYIFKILDDKPALVDWTYQGHYDHLIDGGGGIYFGHTQGKWYHGVINFFVRLIGASKTFLIDVWLRKFLNKERRVKFRNRTGLGLGIGEYHSAYPNLFKQFSDIGSYTHLFVRDLESEALLTRYGYAGSVEVFTDLAFLTEYWMPPIVNRSIDKSIAVILLDFNRNDAEALFQHILDFEKTITARGYTVSYFSIDDVMDKRYREKFETRTLINWKPNEISLTYYLNELAKHSIVVSARAHGAILGACLGLVPIIIPHSQKLIQVSKMFPKASTVYSICADEFLVETVEKISLNLKSCRSAIENDVSLNRDKADAMIKKFLTLL